MDPANERRKEKKPGGKRTGKKADRFVDDAHAKARRSTAGISAPLRIADPLGAAFLSKNRRERHKAIKEQALQSAGLIVRNSKTSRPLALEPRHRQSDDTEGAQNSPSVRVVGHASPVTAASGGGAHQAAHASGRPAGNTAAADPLEKARTGVLKLVRRHLGLAAEPLTDEASQGQAMPDRKANTGLQSALLQQEPCTSGLAKQASGPEPAGLSVMAFLEDTRAGTAPVPASSLHLTSLGAGSPGCSYGTSALSVESVPDMEMQGSGQLLGSDNTGTKAGYTNEMWMTCDELLANLGPGSSCLIGSPQGMGLLKSPHTQDESMPPQVGSDIDDSSGSGGLCGAVRQSRQTTSTFSSLAEMFK